MAFVGFLFDRRKAVWRRVAGTALLCSGLLAACTPALNWRTVTLPEAMLEATLPCRPESAVRPVQWDHQTLSLSVTGCEVRGDLFAVSHLELDDEAQIAPVLMQWQRAVRESVGAQGKVDTVPFVPARAWATPASVRVRLQGARPDGTAVAAQAVWFVRLDGVHAHLYHALVYGPVVDADAADTMFAGLTLLP